MNAFSLAPRRRKSLVILKSLYICDESVNRTSLAMGDVLRQIRKGITAIFSRKASLAVMGALAIVMWWHLISIDNTIAAGEQVAADCLYAMPWALAWAYRTAGMPENKKGGEA